MLTSRRPASGAIAPRPSGERRIDDMVVVAVLAVGLLAFFAQIYPRKGYYFPVGPDAPVYLWWTRLGAHDGLSAVGFRPGVPTLALVLSGALHLSRVEVLAGLGAAGATCVGLASAALVDLGSGTAPGGAERRMRILAAGVLAGTFAVHLADGYFANLLQAALFLGAVAAIAAGSLAGAIAGGALLAASALTHPLFFLLGCGILALASIPTLRRRRPGEHLVDVEGGRLLSAVGAGGALAGLGFAALIAGPGILHIDTSQDAFLRRAGLEGLLHREFRGRFLRHLARYVLPAQVPLGAIGLGETSGFLARFLGTWSVVLVVGVAGALLTGLVPAVRFFAFAFVLPILAALGLVRVHGWIAGRSRPLAAVVALGLAAAIVLGATFTWMRARPFISRTELAHAAVAGRIAEHTPAGTPIVFIVENQRRNVSFLATRANNVFRDAVPPDRIRDVYVFVGSPDDYARGRPTLTGQLPHDAMSRLYLKDVRGAGGRPLAFVLAPFNRTFWGQATSTGDLVSKGVVLLRPHPDITTTVATGPPSDVPPSSGWKLALACLGALSLLAAVGFGWARSVAPPAAALALSPAFGAAGLILFAILFERLGGPLSGWGPPFVSAVVAGGGYLAMLGRRRRGLLDQSGALPESVPQVAQ